LQYHRIKFISRGIGFGAPSFPEKERVSLPLQTSTPNYSIYLRGEGDYTQARFFPGGRGG